MILSYHAVPTEEEMFFISRPLRRPFSFAMGEAVRLCEKNISKCRGNAILRIIMSRKSRFCLEKAIFLIYNQFGRIRPRDMPVTYRARKGVALRMAADNIIWERIIDGLS